MTDTPGAGKYEVGETIEMKGVPKISRADVAEFLLRHGSMAASEHGLISSNSTR